MPFSVDRTPLDSGVMVLTLSGTMTMGAQLRELELAVEALTKGENKKIVVDMSGISYIDSSAIGAIVGCHSLAKTSGGQLRLASVSDRVVKILKIAGVDAVLHRDATREVAVATITT